MLAGWCLLWGLSVLLLRLVFHLGVAYMFLGFGGILPVAVVAAVWALRKTPALAEVRAVLDSRAGMGGLLMAQGQMDIGPWIDRIPPVEPPALEWRWRRTAMQVLACAVLVAVGLLMPDRYLRAVSAPSLELGSEVRDLAEKIEVLKQEKIIPAETAREMQESLEKLRKESVGTDPVAALESLDHLGQSIKKLAESAAEETAKTAEAADAAEALAATLSEGAGQMDSQVKADAIKELAELTQQATAASQALAAGRGHVLGEAVAGACAGKELTPEQLKQLCEAMGQCRAGELARLGRLCKAGLASEAMLSACCGSGQGDPSALAAVSARAGLPGRGGIDRGRGDAAMTWTSGVNPENTQFKEVRLAPAAASLKDALLTGVSAAAPNVAAGPGEPPGGGVLGPSEGESGSAYRHAVLPRYRRTVQRYFERPPK
jgi:hypothetical protein